jgi:hypothetical protein
MDDPPIHISDRVVAKKLLPGVPVGSIGTVVLVFLSAPGYYDICFDGSAGPCVIHRAAREPLPVASTDEAAVA